MKRSRLGVLACAIAITLGGCGASQQEDAPLPVATPTDSEEPVDEKPDEDYDQGSGFVDGDMLSWDDWLEYIAMLEGLEVIPQVELIREIRGSEQSQVMADCISEFGFDTQVLPSGGWSTDSHVDQSAQLGEANYTCYARYPLVAEFYLPYSDEILTRFHQHLAEVSVPCVEAAGYDLKLRSLDTFLAQYKIDRSFYESEMMDSMPSELYDQCEFNSIPERIIMDE